MKLLPHFANPGGRALLAGVAMLMVMTTVMAVTMLNNRGTAEAQTATATVIIKKVQVGGPDHTEFTAKIVRGDDGEVIADGIRFADNDQAEVQIPVDGPSDDEDADDFSVIETGPIGWVTSEWVATICPSPSGVWHSGNEALQSRIDHIALRNMGAGDTVTICFRGVYAPVDTPTPTPTDTPTATATASPTATPTASPTATPTATPSPTSTLSPTATPIPGPFDGSTRVHLAAGTGYTFNPPGMPASGGDLFWDGGVLAAGPGLGFSQPGSSSDGIVLSAPPRFGYEPGRLEPRSGMAFYLTVESDEADKWYSVWVPPGQDFTPQDGDLVFDWIAATPPEIVPGILADIPLLTSAFDGGGDVAITNILVTGALLMLLLGGAALFNEALEENLREVRFTPRLRGRAGRAMDVLRSWWANVAAKWAAIVPGDTLADRALGPAVLLVLTGLIFGFLEPGFGWNQRSGVIFLSLMASQGLIVLFYEGGKAWMLRRRLRVDVGLRLFPASVLIALVSVALSRIGGFHPGFVIGFVAAAVVLGDPTTDVAERGKAYGVVAFGLLVLGLAAGMLAIPLQDLHEAHPSFWTAMPFSVAVVVFIVSIEALVFSLIPLDFMDGSRIWNWNKLVWFALFVPAVLLFLQVLFNDGDAYIELIRSSKSAIGAVVLLIYLLGCFGTWAYFRRRARQGNVGIDEADPLGGA